MKKTILYLATLAALTGSGIAIVNNLNHNAYEMTTAHAASGIWIFVKPLNTEEAKYVSYNPIDGAGLTDAGKEMYTAGSDGKNQYIFADAPYVRDENQVNNSVLDNDKWVGQLYTITLVPKNSSLQPIKIQMMSEMGAEDVTRGTNALPDYISQLSAHYSHPTELFAEDQRVMEAAHSLELAGVIPHDARIQSTLDAMDKDDSLNDSNSSNSQTTTNSSSQSSLDRINKKVQLLRANLKKTTKELSSSKHKSKRDKKIARQKYNKAKKEYNNAERKLKQIENK
ncbi:hypothetical protein [Nicoliella lavandulae]|uniref:DUF1254 domain-containing protein n=1 Tax=Nicoliella lavandulae TaxID=3082954 RepID=A0ABU8SMH8_9LACO